MTELDYDHIVVGAGISGSCAAYQLAKRGVSVLLLEKVISTFDNRVAFVVSNESNEYNFVSKISRS